MTYKLICIFILLFFISNESEGTIISLDDFNKSYNKALQLLESDNQKVSTQFQLYNISDTLILSYQLNSWKYNGSIYSNNNGSDYLYDGEYLVQIFSNKYEMFLYSSEQAKELIKPPKNNIDFSFIKTDSIVKTETEKNIFFSLFPKNSNSEISYTKIEINKLDGKISSMQIKSNENSQNISITKVKYLYESVSEKEFIWKIGDYISQDNGVFEPSKNYNNYKLISYIK